MKKQDQQLARQLFALSFDNGVLSAEKVAGVLAYIEKNVTSKPLVTLRAYQRLVRSEVARGQALVEHAGPIGDDLLTSIEKSMTQRYHRPIRAIGNPSPQLIAGVRVRVGDDVYESSVANQLASLSY